MPNPKGNPSTLKHYQGKWKLGETRTIRVPVVIADDLLKLAHQIDEGELKVSEGKLIEVDKQLNGEVITESNKTTINNSNKIVQETLEENKRLKTQNNDLISMLQSLLSLIKVPILDSNSKPPSRGNPTPYKERLKEITQKIEKYFKSTQGWFK